MSLIEPTLRFAFEARVEIAEPLWVGRAPEEEVMFTPITGGVVAGPRLNGEVLPYGGDWSTTRGKGESTELDARYLLRADDGGTIDIHNRGWYRAETEVEQRIHSGAEVSEAEYYYRTFPVFKTDAAAHTWLNTTVFIGMARAEAIDKVCIRFFALD